ncbi:MAG: hypothetical protein NVS9B1_06330 [Candidatus Dormibacteraceae bacterium]
MRRPSRLTVGALGATTITSAWDLWYWAGTVAAHPYANDFRAYYTAALAGRTVGWGRIYDFAVQQATAPRLGPGAEWLDFINPPPLAWLAAPFTLLPFRAAYLGWSALLLLLLALAWSLAAPGRGLPKLTFGLAAVGLFPVIFALLLGQSAVIVAAGVALCWWLLRREQPLAAGVVLGVALALKPQAAFLVPFALLVGGRPRAGIAALTTVAAFAAASILSLGAGGLHDARVDIGLSEGVFLHRRYAVTGVLGTAPPVYLLMAAFAVLAVVAARRRRGDDGLVVAAGVVGSFLATTHLTLEDFTVLVVAAWLILARQRPAWLKVLLLAGYLVAEYAVVVGGPPLVIFEVALLACLLAASLQHDQDGRAEEDDPERRKDAADHRQHHLQ